MNTPAFRITLHSALVLLNAALFLSRDPVTILFVGGTASLLVYGCLAVMEVFSSPDALTPLSYHFLWSSAALGAAAVYFSLAVWHSGFTGFDTVSYVTAPDLALAYLICLVASFVLHCTLRAIAPEAAAGALSARRIIHPVLGAIIFAIGIFVIVAPPSLAIVGGLPAFLFRCSPLAIMLAIAFGSRHRKRYRLKLLTGTALLLGANMLAFFPYKGGALQSLFPLVIALWKHSRKLAVTAVCLVPLFYLAIVSPFVAASRNKTDVNPLERLSQDAPAVDDGGQFGKLMSRVFEPIEVGFIVSQTRFSGFLGGETMKNIEYVLVPRFLWPDKPTMSTGKWFTVYLGFASREEDATTSTAMTPAGELYWNFGFLGVIFGVAALFLLCGFLWVLAERLGKTTLPGALLFVISITSLNMGDFSGSVINVLGVYTVFTPVLLWPKLKLFIRALFDPPVVLPSRPAN